MTAAESDPGQPLFLDSSIHVGLVLEERPAQAEGLRALTKGPNFLLSCAFGRLEYKRVVIQNWSLALDFLCEEGTFSGALSRASRLQRQRRLSTLVNVLAWIHRRAGAGVIETSDDINLEQVIAQRGIAILRIAIRSGWTRFGNNVHSVVDALNCQRALEIPREKTTGSFDVTVHESLCRNKGCNNANFFRSLRPTMLRLAAHIRELPADRRTNELLDAAQAIERAANNADRLYDYNRCLELGDVWHHLECLQAGVKNFGTTNYRESQILCPPLGLKMRIPEGHPSGQSGSRPGEVGA